MPTTNLKNLMYRAALPLLAPSPKNQMSHRADGLPLLDRAGYEQLLIRHHVLGASLLLTDGEAFARLDTSVQEPKHSAGPDTLYRVASITKMATALVTLRLVQQGAFGLDDRVTALLPDGGASGVLEGITLRQLLSHTSGLCDIPAADRGVLEGADWHEVLAEPGVFSGIPGGQFRYCNLGFGLVGCILEQASGVPLDELYDRELFSPLGMRATMSAAGLDESLIMPISRVLRYHKGQDVTITALGHKPLMQADPLHHYGHSAGAMYTDAPSLSRMMRMIAQNGELDGNRFLDEALVLEMKREHASYGAISPGMAYGLGLVLLRDKKMSDGLILGHQGYAYGCADGAFWEADTGRQVIFLNGGCSEARSGRLGLCNRDVLRWALGKEIPQWQR